MPKFDPSPMAIHKSSRPDPSAALEVGGTTKGFLPPRLSEAQRDGISSPAEGLMVYNSDANRIDLFNGSTWAGVGGGGSSANFASMLVNVGLDTEASGSSLIIRLKQSDGTTDPTASSPVQVAFTAPVDGVTGAGYVIREYTSATSITIPSGATLGATVADEPITVYVYALYDSSAPAVSLGVSASRHDETTFVTTTLLDTSSDSSTPLYAATGGVTRYIRLLGEVVFEMNAAGDWSVAPQRVAINNGYPRGAYLKDRVIGFRAATDTAQTCLGASTFERIEFEDVLYDSEGKYNPTTGTYTIPYTGLWTVGARIYTNTQDTDAGDEAFLRIFLNGSQSTLLGSEDIDDPHSMKNFGIGGTSALMWFVAGQTIDIRGSITDSATTCSANQDNNYFFAVMH